MKRTRKTRLLPALLLALAGSGQLPAREAGGLPEEEPARLQKTAPAEKARRLDAPSTPPAEQDPAPLHLPAEPAKGNGPGPGGDPRIRQIRRYGEPPRTYGQRPPAYGQGPSGGIAPGVPGR